MRIFHVNLIFALGCLPTIGMAQVDTLAAGGASLDGVISSAQPPYAKNIPGQLKVDLTLGCYGVNLRNPSGTVDLRSSTRVPVTITVKDHLGVSQIATLQIPGASFMNGASSPSSAPYTISPAGLSGTAQIHGNSLVTNWGITTDTGTVSATGEMDILKHAMVVQSVTFGNGIRMDNLSKSMSSDGRTLSISARVPSSRIGVCGSFVSPLMVFFDKSRPKFTETTDFVLGQPSDHKVFWPEKGSSGYFLGFDPSEGGKIEDHSQLFGSYESPNGFEKLKELDSNKNGKIDPSDVSFSKLVLWRDKNANGKTDASDEFISLASKGIKEIDLNYVSDDVTSYGHGAQSREHSSFSWVDKQGKEHKGAVEDIWFNTAPNQNRKLANVNSK